MTRHHCIHWLYYQSPDWNAIFERNTHRRRWDQTVLGNQHWFSVSNQALLDTAAGYLAYRVPRSLTTIGLPLITHLPHHLPRWLCPNWPTVRTNNLPTQHFLIRFHVQRGAQHGAWTQGPKIKLWAEIKRWMLTGPPGHSLYQLLMCETAGKFQRRNCTGWGQATPKWATLALGLFWAKGNWDPEGSRESFAPPLTIQKNPVGGLSQKVVYLLR